MTQTAINRVKLAYQEQNSVCPPARGPSRITECLLSKYTGQEGTSVPIVCYVSELDKSVPLDAERLLRLLGVSGKLSGFHFAVYMLEQVQEKPEYVLLITKRLYAKRHSIFIPPPTAWKGISEPLYRRVGDSPTTAYSSALQAIRCRSHQRTRSLSIWWPLSSASKLYTV